MTKHFDKLQEDYIVATFGEEPQCFSCANYMRGAWCRAFPSGQGIPEAIFSNEHDHRKPYEGDNGIGYEPK